MSFSLMTPDRWHDRWLDFLGLTGNVRQIQQMYRRTLDPMLRREMEKLEVSLDVTMAGLKIDLEAAGLLEAADPSLLALATSEAVGQAGDQRPEAGGECLPSPASSLQPAGKGGGP